MYFLARFTLSLYCVRVLESWGLDQPDLGVFSAEGEEVSLMEVILKGGYTVRSNVVTLETAS